MAWEMRRRASSRTFAANPGGGSISLPADALKCKECSTTYPLDARYVCERCFGPLEVAYTAPSGTADELKRRIQAGPHTLWRYADFLPLTGPPRSALPTGWTPLVRADRLAKKLGIGELWIKNETANPTHSFKDRVVSVALARAQELGFETIACASTGNLANAVSAHAAAAGLPSYVFIPADLEEEKILATGAYGTNVVAIRGNYDAVNRLCTELSAERPWAFVNVNVRPYYAEGSKTLAFETAEQLGWELPDRVIAPIASGSLFTKVARGFQEFIDADLLSGSVPTMCGAQAEGCSPVAQAFAAGTDVCRPVKPDTIAKSLAIGNPADGPYAVELAQATGGVIESVTDEEIVAGIRLLAETTGIFTETAGGVTTAVLAKLAEAGAIDANERVVAYITGDGLKTPGTVKDTFAVTEIAPSVDEFEAAFAGAVA
jgi:threonine synthase